MAGLLGPEPWQLGLLNAASGMMQGGNLRSGMGNAFAGFGQGYNQGLVNRRRGELVKLRKDEAERLAAEQAAWQASLEGMGQTPGGALPPAPPTPTMPPAPGSPGINPGSGAGPSIGVAQLAPSGPTAPGGYNTGGASQIGGAPAGGGMPPPAPAPQLTPFQTALSNMGPVERANVARMTRKDGMKYISDRITDPLKPTTLMQNAAALGLEKGTPEYNAFMREVMLKSDVNITMGEDHVEPTSAVMTKMQNSYDANQGNLVTLNNLLATTKKDYSTIPGQAKYKTLAFLDELGLPITSWGEEALAEYTTWSSDTFSLVNKTLHELSGAAINPSEAERLMKELSSTQDSPVEYIAKLEAAPEAHQECAGTSFLCDQARHPRQGLARSSCRVR